MSDVPKRTDKEIRAMMDDPGAGDEFVWMCRRLLDARTERDRWKQSYVKEYAERKGESDET